MDAHVFRRCCDALTPFLCGARLEKIQSPVPDVSVLTFYNQQRKRHLVLRAGRRDPFLFLTTARPVAGKAPPATVMRLRKYCAGRRVAACLVDWAGRRLALLFQAPAESLPPDINHPSSLPPETWLVLDLREGPSLLLGQAPPMPEEPRWPVPQELPAACADWRQWPVLTPALRRTLPHLEALDQAALLADLEYGGGDVFVYTSPEGGSGEGGQDAESGQGGESGQGAESGMPPEISAWPLPRPLRGQRAEQIFEDALEAVAALGADVVLGQAEDKARAAQALPHEREAARLEKLLQKLEAEESRLRGMEAAREKGLALQQVLWRHGAEARLAVVETDDPQHPRVDLDLKLSLGENMQAFFHQAARGKRGLAHMVQRRQSLTAQLAAVRERAGAASLGMPTAPLPKNKGSRAEQAAVKAESSWPKGIQPFRSSDGFLILRGRDAKGNGAVLRAAAAQDLWLHVEGGPGSHAIIRRQYLGQEIPERTLLEAASLAAVKSWQKDNPTAQILCAEVRHVKPLRGAAPGTVRIDKVAQTFRVDIDSSVEARLAL